MRIIRKTESEENNGIWKNHFIHFIRDPKGITYVRLILKIESDAKMAVPNGVSKTQVLSD